MDGWMGQPSMALSSYSQPCQAQTPTQRRANEKHAKSVEKRMGKPETSFKKKETKKSPVGIAAVGTFSTYLRPPIHLFTCSLPTSSFFLCFSCTSLLLIARRFFSLSSRFFSLLN